MESNSSRIAKNTLFLYFRSFFVLLISLYTSRVVLRVLGIEDYGIYNVVGGVIGMISFLNSSMASTYQRYFNFEMSRDEERLSDLFKSSITVQLIYALIIVFLAESVGLWLLKTQLVIPAGRMFAAKWVFHISIASFVISVFQAPFTAIIIANEKMNIFAIVSILDSLFKLLIVFLLPYVGFDKLIVYAFLLFIITVIDFFIYIVVCMQRFSSCQISLNWRRENLKSLFSFGSWAMIDSLSQALKSQGINILLNMFFGSVVNAARGIAYQVLSAVNQFVVNFQTSFRPQLTKSYAEGNLPYMFKLYYSSTKISFYLLWCLSLPIIIETPMIMNLWLGDNVPEYTVAFTRIILLTALVSAYANPTSAIAYATGNIKLFNLLVSGLNLLIVPIAYVFLKLGFSPKSSMIVSLVISIIVQVVRVLVTRRLLQFSVKAYLKEVIIPTMLVFFLSPIIPMLIKNVLPGTLLYSLVNCIFSIISVCVFAWLIGLNSIERKLIEDKLRVLLH